MLSPPARQTLGRSPSVSPREFGTLNRSPSNESLKNFNALRNQNSYTTLPATNDGGYNFGGGMQRNGSVSFLSPVISAARKEVRNFGLGETQTEMMDRRNSFSVQGHNFMNQSELGSTKNSQMRQFAAFRRGKKSVAQPSMNISVNDIVHYNKKAFGFEGYKSPSNKQLIIDAFSNKKFAKLTAGRTKKESFIAEQCRRKAYMIQGPDHYSKIENWEKNLPKRHGMFLKTERRTIAGEIQHKHKKVETCTPGIGLYNPDAWRAGKTTRIKGHYGKTSERITDLDNYLAIHGPVPAPIPGKESAIIPDDKMTRTRSISTLFEMKLQRWDPAQGKDNSPSSATYEIAESIEKAQWPKKREFQFGSQARTSMFKQISDKAFFQDNNGIKKNKIPGIGAYKTDKGYDLTVRSSPLQKTKRH